MKKKILSILVFFCISFCVGCTARDRICESKYYNSEKLTELYFEYKEDFEKTAQIMLNNDQVYECIIEEKNGDMGIQTQYDSKFFSEEEWSTICDFFAEVQPLMVIRSIKNNDDIVYFAFRISKDSKQTILYRMEKEDTINAYYLTPFRSDFKEIDDGWWIIEYDYNKRGL